MVQFAETAQGARVAMAMPPCGTFAYVTVLPKIMADDQSRWPMQCLEIPEKTGDFRQDDRLLGYTPSLELIHTGRPSSEGPTAGIPLPTITRTRLTLRASTRKGATVKAASFYLAKIAVAALQTGDTLHIARTHCGGLGVSALRDGSLIFAAGAVTAVPLGDSVSVKTPEDLVEEAGTVFKSRDPRFTFRELPIEVRVGEQLSVSFTQFDSLGQYHVYVAHGFRPGLPGTDECVGLGRMDVCKANAGRASAEILEHYGLEMIPYWLRMR